MCTAHPGYLCVVKFRSDCQLHSNVFPNCLKVAPVPGQLLLRIVPYCLKRIDQFCSAVTREPGLWQRAKSKLDLRLWLLVNDNVLPYGYCVCGLDIGGLMIECSGRLGKACPWFGGWWHQTCVGVEDPHVTCDDLMTERTAAAWRSTDWLCPLCRDDQNEEQTRLTISHSVDC